MTYLLDTDFCIHVMRRHFPAARQAFAALRPGDAGISVITFGELAHGIAKSHEAVAAAAQLQTFIGLVPVLPLHDDTGAHYGLLRAQLEQRGQVIGNNDLWIAAHALAQNLTLVTHNGREFSRIPGLRLEDWSN